MVHSKKLLFTESKGSTGFAITKGCQILDSGTYWKKVFSAAIFEHFFPPRGDPYDLDKTVFL